MLLFELPWWLKNVYIYIYVNKLVEEVCRTNSYYLWLEEDLSDNAGPGLGLRISCGIGLGDEDELHELLAPELELEGDPQRSSLQPLDSLYEEYM